MGGKKGSKSNVLGRLLIKDRFGQTSRRKVDNDSMLHTTEIQDGYEWGRLNLQSVTEESSFQEFLRTAELAGTEFQAEKLNISFVNPKSNIGLLTTIERNKMQKMHIDKKSLLKIPRRPKWTTEMTADDLQRSENESFLEWRRGLATLQENDGILMTPYEKNLEFWRQLWRVVERSDVIVQIVDGRNPLLFRNEDLEKYVTEVGENKLNMILINKADLLTNEQRKIWSEYFKKEGIRVAFFSAVLAIADEEANKLAEKLSLESITIPENNLLNDNCSCLSNPEVQQLKTSADELSNCLKRTEEQLIIIEKKLDIKPVTFKEDWRVLNRTELIELFENIHKGKKHTENITTIGFLGYPNVGKSSTINALMTEKKVSVSATPGKTKHFQTLFLKKDLMLCDCPGLVMPSFVLTKADMILNGILPIDQMRDHVPPVNQLCVEIPRHILEDKYGIIIAKPIEGEDPNRCPYSEELLLAYGYNRGFMTSNGQPDQSRSARYVLKDYVKGQLLFCHAPPTVEQSTYQTFPDRIKKEIKETALPNSQQRAMRINKNTSSKEIDSQFFVTGGNKAYIKGRSNFPHIHTGIADPQQIAKSINGNTQVSDKPWRHAKKEKREKLRKKFAHLDQH